jgi:hypothetical protein
MSVSFGCSLPLAERGGTSFVVEAGKDERGWDVVKNDFLWVLPTISGRKAFKLIYMRWFYRPNSPAY